jgi:hypothetical protein
MMEGMRAVLSRRSVDLGRGEPADVGHVVGEPTLQAPLAKHMRRG